MATTSKKEREKKVWPRSFRYGIGGGKKRRRISNSPLTMKKGEKHAPESSFHFQKKKREKKEDGAEVSEQPLKDIREKGRKVTLWRPYLPAVC